LPTPEESCARFLAWCAPLLSEDELAATEAAVAELLRADGPVREAQAVLERYARVSDSWIDSFWAQRYLGRRDRIALNANFFLLLQDSCLGQVDRAAELIAAAVEYKLLLDAQRIPPLVRRGQVQSMEQYKFLFSATRIPGRVSDTSRTPYSSWWPGPSQERHIVVFFRRNAFRMNVIGAAGGAHSPAELAAGLRAVMAAGSAPSAAPVGHLTSKARASWAQSRENLLRLDPANAVALDAVETALFAVCLEDFCPADAGVACDQLLHGDSGNRWFDKSFSLIVFADGRAGLNVEHSRLDGVTMVELADVLLSGVAAAGDGAERSAGSGAGPVAPEPLEFVLDDGLRADVAAAAESFRDYAAVTATCAMTINDFGADRIKEFGVSPDSFAQLSFQLAHKRARGVTGATYESVATRCYRHGRTEAMRVVTPEVIGFVRAMDDPGTSRTARRRAFALAADAHVERLRECQSGQAPEQHLWELQLLQRRRGAELGALALDSMPGWVRMREDYLSTSSATSERIQYLGFGATGERCIGVAYMLLADRFSVYLSAGKGMRQTLARFADQLREAVRELEDLLADDAG
jgi:carnitine O-acetyltransferase